MGQSRMKFHISKKSKLSNARLGFIETPHGAIETPCIVPVATQAAVKTLESEEAESAKCQMLICNTFHLHIKPGDTIVRKAGGLHTFMQWKKPLMTDSGGFQVFSLGFGKDYGIGKILKTSASHEPIRESSQPQEITITSEGVRFRSPVDGKPLFIGPKESIRIQENLGADIIFAFDECTPPGASYQYTKQSLEKTHAWAKACLKAKKFGQALFGIVQGGKFEDLRRTSAQFIGSMEFDGFGIGGEFGNDKKKIPQMLDWVISELPERKPRHLLGIGHLEDIETIVKSGVDTFDCTVPTHYARRGIAFTSEGRLNLRQSKFLKKQEPLDKGCTCHVCLRYKKNYICHLLKAGELTAPKLITFHNLWYFNGFVEEVRKKIREGEI